MIKGSGDFSHFSCFPCGTEHLSRNCHSQIAQQRNSRGYIPCASSCLQRDPRRSMPQEEISHQPWAAWWLEQLWEGGRPGVLSLSGCLRYLMTFSCIIQEFPLAACTTELDWCSLVPTSSLSQRIFRFLLLRSASQLQNRGENIPKRKSSLELPDCISRCGVSPAREQARECAWGAERLVVTSTSAGHARRTVLDESSWSTWAEGCFY